jgi:hypothetical protein
MHLVVVYYVVRTINREEKIHDFMREFVTPL